MSVKVDVLTRRQRMLLSGTAALLFVLMVSSFTPTPLYPVYQLEWGISDAQIALAFAGYPIGVIPTLILMGGVSDRFGRRGTLIISSVVMMVALSVLAAAIAFPMLILGRILQGIGAALAAGAGAATLMESHPQGLSRGSFVNTLAIASGSALGPLLSGFLAEVSPAPLVLPYLAVAALVAILLVFLVLSEDIVPRDGHARFVKPIRLPRRIWAPFSLAAVTILATNLGMSIYGSFGAEIAISVGLTSELSAGLVVFVFLSFVAIAQIIGRRFRPRMAMTIGSAAATIGWLVVAFASFHGTVWLLALGSAVLGSGAGLCLMGSAELVGIISPTDRRAEIYSVYLMVAFGALATMAIASGSILEMTQVGSVLLAAGGVCALLTAYVVVMGRRFLPARA
jgi:MFS family permease